MEEFSFACSGSTRTWPLPETRTGSPSQGGVFAGGIPPGELFLEVLQAIWTIKSLGLVKLICLLTPHGKGYFVCAKPKVVGVQWSNCVQCSVECIVYSVQCAVCSVQYAVCAQWSKTNSLSRKWLCCLIASPHAIHCLQQFEYVCELSWSYGRQSSKARNPKVHFPKTDLTFQHLCHW